MDTSQPSSAPVLLLRILQTKGLAGGWGAFCVRKKRGVTDVGKNHCSQLRPESTASIVSYSVAWGGLGFCLLGVTLFLIRNNMEVIEK